MWIRSQNKKELINVKCFSLFTIPNATVNIQGDDIHIGGYSTKEKALKVLDMIQNDIDKDCTLFIMPQDEEVDV